LGTVYTRSHKVENIKDLAGLYVGVVEGDIHAEMFKNLTSTLGSGFTLISYENYFDVFEAIAKGDVEVGVANRLYGMRYAASKGLHPTSILFDPLSIRFAVSPQASAKLLPMLNQGLKDLKSNSGSVYYISREKWLSPVPSDSLFIDSPHLIWWLVFFGVIVLGAGVWVMRRLSITSLKMTQRENELKEETEVRKRAQVALWESVERHRAMFTDNMLPQILVDGANNEIVEVNPAAEKFYQYPIEKLIGMNLLDINAQGLPAAKQYVQDISLGTNRIITKQRKASGKVYDVELFISTLYIHERKHKLITVVDISERVAAEQARMESEERLELAVKGGDLAFWDWDLVTGTMIFNERYAEILGYRLQDLGNTHEDWIVRLHPDDYDLVQDDLRRALETRDVSHHMQLRMRTRSGNWRWLVSRGRVSQRTDTGKPLRMTGIAYDITSRKKTEDRLASINDCMLGFVPDPDTNISRLTA